MEMCFLQPRVGLYLVRAVPTFISQLVILATHYIQPTSAMRLADFDR